MSDNHTNGTHVPIQMELSRTGLKKFLEQDAPILRQAISCSVRGLRHGRTTQDHMETISLLEKSFRNALEAGVEGKTGCVIVTLEAALSLRNIEAMLHQATEVAPSALAKRTAQPSKAAPTITRMPLRQQLDGAVTHFDNLLKTSSVWVERNERKPHRHGNGAAAITARSWVSSPPLVSLTTYPDLTAGQWKTLSKLLLEPARTSTILLGPLSQLRDAGISGATIFHALEDAITLGCSGGESLEKAAAAAPSLNRLRMTCEGAKKAIGQLGVEEQLALLPQLAAVESTMGLVTRPMLPETAVERARRPQRIEIQ